jgi:hypothetical protein
MVIAVSPFAGLMQPRSHRSTVSVTDVQRGRQVRDSRPLDLHGDVESTERYVLILLPLERLPGRSWLNSDVGVR